ncbi:leucine-rich repeat-containing protein 34-like [Sinocyclocheilus anshuiensis]|uniref:leucine-rich repeat-containing protein 34-like n=1 Tax=Sinocyclocheilus anshuiensis TaxID=1608454 RepID=UPI0007B83A1A|nr:PREDICTED: leucine-rich repeat-containing protein 34-like [Sinocyclocheilus anshuiensis]
MEDLQNRYLSVYVEVQQPPNTCVLEVLEDNISSDGSLKLTGNVNDQLKHGDRLTDDDMLVLSKTLVGNSAIKGLDLRYNNITDKGAVYVAHLIQENESLQSLDLMCNNIEAYGAEMIAKSMHKNKSLKMLRMTGNKIGNKGAMQLAAMLQINSTLEEIDISDCDLATQSVVAFAIVLKNNRKICAINAGRPLLFSLQEETTVHMAQMLVVNKTLRELHLGKHDMTDTGVERLREALKLNVSLRYLDLHCNRITRDGAKCLSEVLKQNPSLEILDLSSNRIEDDGAVYLSEAIKLPHSKLKALSVTSNNIGKEGLKSFNEAMKVNSCLTHIYIWGNKLEKPVCVAFSRLISSGRLLEEHTDVSPYEVDDHVFLAEVSHGLRRHYYWTSRYGEYRDSSNSALALMQSDSLALQIHPDSHS